MSSDQFHGTPPCEEWQPKITAYADGELPAEETAALEAHVAACPACAAVLAEVRAMKSVLGVWAIDEKYIAERVEARVAATTEAAVPEIAQRRAAGLGATTRRTASDILIERGKVEAVVVSKARELAEATGAEVGEMLIRLGLVSERDAVEARSFARGVPFIDLVRHKPEAAALQSVAADAAHRLAALPVKKDGQRLWVAMENPHDVAAVDELRFLTRCMVQPMAAAPSDLRAELSAAYGAAGSRPPVPPPPTAVGADAPASGGRPDDDRDLTFEEVQRKYESRVYNLILRYVEDREAAEDLTVETFVKAWRNRDRIRNDKAQTFTWLTHLAKQAVADWAKTPFVGPATVPADQMSAALDALAPELREVFVLAEQENLSYEEIASMTGLSLVVVKTRLHRARNQVRHALETSSPAAGAGDIDNEPLAAADELRRMRELVASLVAETRGMREEMTALRAEVAEMRREQRAAARSSAANAAATATVTRYAVAAPPRQAELLPWAPPADAPAPLT